MVEEKVFVKGEFRTVKGEYPNEHVVIDRKKIRLDSLTNPKKVKMLTEKEMKKIEENLPLRDKIDKQLSRAGDS